MQDYNPAIGDRLRRAANLVAQPAAPAVGVGVTSAESTLLRVLHDAGAVSPSVLAARMGLTRGAVTKLVDRLRAKRLVVRAGAGRDDRRYRTIALTGAGAVLVPKLAAMVDAHDAAIGGLLAPEEWDTLDRLLRTLIDRAGVG